MTAYKFQKSHAILFAAVSAWATLAARAAVSYNTSSTPVAQGQTNGVNNPAETISFEGQGSLAKVIGTPAFAYLNLTGTNATPSLTLNNGPSDGPTTYSDTSISTSAYLNLASQNFTAADVGVNSPSTVQQTDSALRLEWHWNGTVDGSNDLINDQVGYNQSIGPVSPQGGADRGPSVANPIYVNSTNHFTGAGGAGTLNTVTLNGFTLSQNTGVGTYNTYSATNYDQAGNNLLGGMNRVQFSFSDYKTLDYSVTGTPSVYAAPGSAGYGNGNPAIPAAANNLLGIGASGAREAYQPNSIANMPTTNIDPSSVSTTNPGGTAYAAGPWNSAGTDSLSSTPIGANAVLIAANPGTGLSRLDKGDSQWIQTAGRLANGLQFDTVSRDADLGQRPTFATATGIDGTWAVGVNDGGDTTTTANANLQHTIGSLKFSGKSADSEVYNTIAQSRMGAGVLALTSTIAANSYGPVRSLDIDFNDLTDPQLDGGGTDDTRFISANLNTISTYQYQAVLLGYATTVKAPNPTALAAYESAHPNTTPGLTQSQIDSAAWAQMSSFNPSNLSDSTTTGIKGDTTGDVARFLTNLINSSGSYQSLTTTNDPADALLNNSYLLPNLLQNMRDPSTGIISANPNYDAPGFAKATAIYANKFNADYSGSYGKDIETTGAGSNYGSAVTGGQSPSTFNGNIPITAYNADGSAAPDGTLAPGGNWLFGNFNQNGVRDLSAIESGLAAAKALYNIEPSGTSGANSAFSVTSGTANAVNSTPVTYTDVNGAVHNMTKGDIIVLGDFQGTGKFDGVNLEAIARGSAASDASGVGYTGGTISGGQAEFADTVRRAVLRKNTAMDYLQSNTADASYNGSGNPLNASAFLRLTGRAVLTIPGVTTAAGVPSGATALGVNPVSSLEQFTFDPTGLNTFNKSDINADGVVDLNDAVLADNNIGNDFTNLTEQLASTQQAPVTGATISLNLASAKQSDGSTLIDSSDVAVVSNAMTGAGNTNWYGFNLQKTGPSTMTWARTGGTVAVASGASFEISSGVVDIGGSIDPFTDTTGGSSNGNHLSLNVDGGALKFTASSTRYNVSRLAISGNGTVDVGTNRLTINYAGASPLGSILTDVRAGSLFSSDSSSTYSMGYADNGSQVAIAYTLNGDINLDGAVNGTDFGVLAANFGKTVTGGWTQGDLDGDGAVTGSDFALLAKNFGNSANGFSVDLPQSEWTALDNFAAAHGLLSDVPEPATFALSVAAGAALLFRRRRRSSNLRNTTHGCKKDFNSLGQP